MRLAPAVLGSLLLLAPALAGCLGADEDEPVAGQSTAPPLPPRPAVVIAVVDTGMNFYHAEYRRDAATVQPAPATDLLATLGVTDVTNVALSLALDDWSDAEKQDHDELMKMEKGALYTFPGTKVLAAVSFQDRADDWPLILDHPERYTHGTMTTSRATGNAVSIGGADPDIHLVIVQGFSPESVRWAAEQPWIDIISISAGLSPFGIVPMVPNALDGQMGAAAIPTYNFASHQKPFFASTGNGVGNAGLLGFPSWSRGSSGVPDAISVGANDNDHISHWHNQHPYVSADGCNNPAASPGDTTEIGMTGGGTSSATPFSAGGGAKLLLEARRILGDTHVGPRVDETLAAPDGWASGHDGDAQVVLAQGEAGLVAGGPLADGVFTLLEFKDVLYHTALVTPSDDDSDGQHCGVETIPGDPFTVIGGTYVPASAVPEPARFVFQGYGEINHASIDAAIQAIAGTAPLPSRGEDDTQYAQAHAIKTTVVGSDE